MLTLRRRTLFVWADRELTDEELAAIRDKYMAEGADYGRRMPAAHVPLLALMAGLAGLVAWIGIGLLV